eukprot:s399_g17.t2
MCASFWLLVVIERCKDFAEYCALIKSDEKFAADSETARAALEEEEEARAGCALPLFRPSADVAEGSRVGHLIYTKGGLLSEADLVKYTKKTPKDLGLSAFCTEWQGATATQFFVISLADLPEELKWSIKRIKLYHDTYYRHDKLWLTPDTQLSKRQGADVAEHLNSKFASKKRPAGMLQPASLQSLSDLQDLARILEAQRLEQLQKDGSSDAVEAASAAAPKSAMLAALEDEEEPTKRKRPKKQDPKTKAADPGQQLALSDAVSTTASSSAGALALADAPPSSTGKSDTSKSGKKGDQFQGLDDEMRQVAQLHMASSQGKNVSVKSLQTLVPAKYMQGGTDHSRAHALVAAKKFRETLVEKHPHAAEVQILERRIRDCTGLQQLAEKSAKALAAWDELDLTIRSLKDHWDNFTLDIKTKVTFAHLINRMGAISDFKIKDDSDLPDLQKKGNELVDALLPHVGNTSWDPNDATFAGLCSQAFSCLEVNVFDLQNGRAEDDSRIKQSADDCSLVLQVNREGG